MDNKFNLVDFFNAYKNQKIYEKYSQDADLQAANPEKWASADVNKDGKLDETDSKALDEHFETVSKSETLYDLNGDDEVKFDDLFEFSEKMDIDGNGRVCVLEEQLLDGKTPEVFAKVQENLNKDEKFNLKDFMSYSKAVSNLSDEKKTSLKTEIASLEDTMISKLETKYGSDYDINEDGTKGDINDLKSFWTITAGADDLNLSEESKLKTFLDNTETGLRTNVKAQDETMTDTVLDNMKKEVQTQALSDNAPADETEGTQTGGQTGQTGGAEEDCGCDLGGTGQAGQTGQTGQTGQSGQTGGSSSSDDCGCDGTSGTGHTGGTGYSGGTTSTRRDTIDSAVNTRSQSYDFIYDKLGYNRTQMQLDTIEYDEQGRVSFFEKKWEFNCRHSGDEQFFIEYDDCGNITVTKQTDEGREKTFYELKQQPQPTCDPHPQPTCDPHPQPTCDPHPQPTCHPSVEPTVAPTVAPTTEPTCPPQPTCHPNPWPQPGPQVPSTGGSQSVSINENSTTQIDISTGDITQITNYGYMGGDGDDTYIDNYTVNSYTTVNNYNTVVTNTTTTTNTTINNDIIIEPTVAPTVEPTVAPTVEPTVAPTVEPTVAPTVEPTVAPTVEPTVAPTVEPTVAPTVEPTVAPTVEPTVAPTVEPTVAPTVEPTVAPTVAPTVDPGGHDEYDLMPLKSLLRGLDFIDDDGVISDDELTAAFNNPTIGGGIDGDPTSISAEELAILNKIKQFNQDKELITNVLKDDYSKINSSTMDALQELSDEIKKIHP